MVQLPNEIWLNVVDILGNQGHTRDLVNLLKALNFDVSLSYKFLKKEFIKSRWRSTDDKRTYNEKMIDLWERAGIDDGVPCEYLLKNLNKKTRMFRTMWSYETLKNKENIDCLLDSIVFDCCGLNNEFKAKYTDSFFEDKRTKPKQIISWWGELSGKSRQLVLNYSKNFKNKNTIDVYNREFP